MIAVDEREAAIRAAIAKVEPWWQSLDLERGEGGIEIIVAAPPLSCGCKNRIKGVFPDETEVGADLDEHIRLILDLFRDSTTTRHKCPKALKMCRDWVDALFLQDVPENATTEQLADHLTAKLLTFARMMHPDFLAVLQGRPVVSAG